MADDKKPEGGGLTSAVPVTVVLALLANLIYSHMSPYQDERPSNHPLKGHYEAAQDVDARLWQDPFAAVNEASDETPKEKLSIKVSDGKTLGWDASPDEKSTSHAWYQIYKGHLEPKEDITVIAVTLPGGPYQEAAEQRMRRRYAVLSGLANQGATPKDEQHIGYFHPVDSKNELQKNVAFEWWSLADDNKKVLLLWIDESSLLGSPATKLKALLGQTNPSLEPLFEQKNLSDEELKEQKVLKEMLNNVTFNYTVIGPNTSTLLRDMLKEVKYMDIVNVTEPHKECKNETPSKLGKVNNSPLKYYSAGATASDFRLLTDIPVNAKKDETIYEYLCERGVTLYRTTATEKEMMETLADELHSRRVDKNDQVVILSEWDTYYGRSMPKAFMCAWKVRPKELICPDVFEYIPHVQVFGYMRGLDGKLPDKGDKSSSVAEKKPESKDNDKSDADADALIESPEGQSQKDYLRRLAEHILDLEHQFKNQGDPKGVSAIGVLGSDVHDKLLILESLRQHFPHKLFFTTDLDAAYIHPAKWRQTHNLLVASAFDLTLRPELQGTIPPFRDSYQTAFFLATQGILNNITLENMSPRLFEIGRNHPIPLPTNEDMPQSEDEGEDKAKCSWVNWSECNNKMHPQIFAKSLLNWTVTGVIVIFDVMAAILFFYFVFPWFRKKVIEALNYCNSNRKDVVVVILKLLLFYFLMVCFLKFYFTQIEAEPFYWLEGVSIWPSQLLRLSIILVVYFVVRLGNERIKKMLTKLNKEIPTTFVLPKDKARSKFPWVRLFIGNWKEITNKNLIMNVKPEKLWRRYLGFLGFDSKTTPSLWFWRVVIHVIVFSSVALILIVQTGFPNAPTRGYIPYILNFVIIVLAVLSTLFMIVWVVENARLCNRLIENLSARPSVWTPEAHQWAKNKNNVAPECVNDWLDIKLVEHLTATMQPLIIGPVVCVALLLLARSPVIDDWDLPWGLEIVYIAMLLYSISAEVFLQRGAKKARKKAIDHLTMLISKERNQNPPNSQSKAKPHQNKNTQQPQSEVVIKRIEAEIERIKDLREGAFRPWYEWPLLQSFGGLGTLWVALQYFAGVWGNGSF